MNFIPRFHDATLETCTIMWEEGTIVLRLSTAVNGTGIILLKGTGVTDFACPRQSPWGPSDSVNEVRVEPTDKGHHVEIEMQSGDTLTMTCENVACTAEEEHAILL